jgi:hypothetical protein
MRIANILPVVAIGLAVIWISPLRRAMYADELFVSPAGENWRLGSSRESAFRTVQRAADVARAGTTIVILPGVYPEWLRIRHGGDPGRPVTFRADTPGTVTLTGAAGREVVGALEWNHEGQGLYSAEPPWPVYRMTMDGRVLLNVRWGGVSNLLRFCSRPDAQGAFAYVEGKVHLSLANGVNPSTAALSINRKAPNPGLWGFWRAANVWIEADHVILDGLRLVWGLGSSVRLWDSSYVAVRNTLMTGAQCGVNGSGLQAGAGLVIENCLYHNDGQRQWRDGWLSKAEAYAFENARLVSGSGPGVRVKHNLVVSSHDGISVSPRALADPAWSEVAYNVIAGCIDDAAEFDGQANHVWFHHNLVYDCHQSLGLSPVLGGPVIIEKNAFLHPRTGINQANLKLLNPWWQKPLPLSGPIRNVTLRDNLFTGRWLSWHATARTRDLAIQSNVFAVAAAQSRPWPPGVVETGNRYLDLSQIEYPDPAGDVEWLRARLDAAGLGATRLSPGPLGAPWQIPRPGPAWYDWSELALTAALRRKLDASEYVR